MYGLSTAWKSKELDDGNELLNQLLEAEIAGLELEYRISAKIFEQMRKPLRQSSVTVLSIHNYFPHPEILPASQASGDAFLLSSTDKEERARAVQYTRRTIQIAHDLEVGAVVLHLGKVEMEREKEILFKLFDDGQMETEKGKKFIAEKLKERESKKSKNLDAVLFSLDVLNKEAIKRSVWLGIENRYYLDEIPSLEEIGYILERFEGGNICYWHDVGHAQVSENFGITPHQQFLETYAPQMLGIHLHDCKGRHDHIAPGSGEVDFDLVGKYLTKDVITIIEVHSDVSLSQLQEAVEFLKARKIIED